MSTGRTIEYLTAGDLTQALDRLRTFFGPNYYGAIPQFVQWQYFDNPFKTLLVDQHEYSILAMMDRDRNILALDAFVPWTTVGNGRDYVTVWDFEWINFSEIPGLGRQLLKELRQRTEVYCGYGLNELSKNAFQKLGFTMRNEIERYVAIIDARACWQLFEKFAVAGQREFLFENEAARTESAYVVIDQLESLSGDYWTAHQERFAFTSNKSIEALEWRYIRHPFIKYDFVSLSRTANEGLAVLRLERIKDTEQKVLRVLELLPVGGCESALAEAVVAFAADNGAIVADFFCAASGASSQLCPGPFIPLAKHRAYDIPMLFQPMEVRERKSINLVYDVSPGMPSKMMADYYATKGDGDQDVQVNHDYVTVST